MEPESSFHIILACVLFISLFTYTVLPGPLNRITDLASSVGFFGYKVVRGLGVTTDYRICSLLDAFNYGGMTAGVWTEGAQAYTNMSCAVLSENKVAIGRYEVEKYGDQLFGTAEKFYIENRRQVNKVFYGFYMFFGLMITGVIGDIFITFGQFRTKTSNAIAIGGVASIALTMLIMRTGPFWSGLELLINAIPGSGSIIASLLAGLLIMGPLWWMLTHILIGYKIAKKGAIDPFKAIETAVATDVKKGTVGLKAVQGKK